MLGLYRIHTCIARYAVKSWHNKYSNTFKELQCFQLWAWQGVGGVGCGGDAENSWWGRSMEKFSLYQQQQQQQRHCTIRLMFFWEFECIRLVTNATPTRIAHTYTHTQRDSRSGSEKARRCCCKCNWPKVPSVRVEERDFSLLPREMLTRYPSPSPSPSSPSPLTTGQRVCCVDWNVSPARAI